MSPGWLIRHVYIGDDFLVLDKPPGVLVHPTKPGGKRTLLCELKERYPGEFCAFSNRLDRETSGLVIVARSPAAASAIGKIMTDRGIQKEYLALVSGKTPSNGEIDAPIDRIGKFRETDIHLKRGVIEGGYPCKTLFETLGTRTHPDSGREISCVRLLPQTGRIHQLRVHMQHIGHPILGDKLYGSDPCFYLEMIEKGWTDEMEKTLLLKRQALHATVLQWEWNGAPMRFESALPDDLAGFWQCLRLC